MPRSSIETLLHAFVRYPHVDHTHADATNMICAAEFVAEKSAGKEPFGGRRMSPLPPDKREELLAAVLPTLRGAVSGTSPKILRADTSEEVIEFVCGEDSSELSQVGAACPDHLVQTKVRPLWVEFDPEREGAAELREKLLE